MSTHNSKPLTRMVNFVSDFFQPWVISQIENRKLRGEIIRLLGQIKQAVYRSGGWH